MRNVCCAASMTSSFDVRNGDSVQFVSVSPENPSIAAVQAGEQGRQLYAGRHQIRSATMTSPRFRKLVTLSASFLTLTWAPATTTHKADIVSAVQAVAV